MTQLLDTNADASTDNALAPATMPTIDADVCQTVTVAVTAVAMMLLLLPP